MIIKWIRRALMIAMLVLIGLRPTIPGSENAETSNSNLDVLFVVDTTMSMLAEDYDGTNMRLTGVRADIKTITEKLTGARFALIGFDNTAYLSVPFTTDSTSIIGAADVISPIYFYYANGTSIDAPIDIMRDTLETATKKTERSRIVFYMGDGEQTSDTSPKSFSELRGLIDAGAVLGYGTESGGKFKEVSYAGTSESYATYFDENYNMRDALSIIDETNLRNIANDIGVVYLHSENTDDVARIIDEVSKSATQISTGRKVSVRQDIYWIFALVFVGLLLWELWTILDELFPKKGKLR